MLERWLSGQSEPAETSPAGCGHAPAETAEDAAVVAFLRLDEPLSQRRVADAFGLSRPRVAELVRPYLALVEREAA
jgi:hypothetical protein